MNTVGISLFFVYFIQSAISGDTCPTSCSCDSILEKIDCSGRGLTHVPGGLPSTTRTLDLHGNQIVNVKGAFQNLPNLQTLALYHNQIVHIVGAFQNFPNLQYLHLGHNQIVNVIGAFQNLPNLQTLYLYNNQIVYISGAFQNLPNLQYLNLNFNRIISVTGPFQNLPKLQTLYFERNPLVCTCVLKDCLETVNSVFGMCTMGDSSGTSALLSSLASDSKHFGNCPVHTTVIETTTTTTQPDVRHTTTPTIKTSPSADHHTIPPMIKTTTPSGNCHTNTPMIETTTPSAGKPVDCDDVLAGGGKSSGVYTIYPIGVVRGLEAYCDQATDGGRWTVFQRRIDGAVDFFRTWNDYAFGFGNLNGDFWLGNEILKMLTSNKHYELQVELESFDGEMRYANYRLFELSSNETQYTLSVGGYSGTAGDSLGKQTGLPFSTYDQDHTQGSSCPAIFNSGWWFHLKSDAVKVCQTANLNGLYLLGQHASLDTGIYWMDWKGEQYSYRRCEMKIRPRA